MSKIVNEQTGEGEDTAAIQEGSLDTFFEILANTYRRQLLFSLLEHDRLDDDYSPTSADVTSSDDQESQRSIQMIHTHLPKLDDADIIEWNQDNQTVRKGSRFDEIRPLVQMLREIAD
jgi:predicted transcriptional regulator